MMQYGDDRLPPRFWDRVRVDASGCWTWTGAKTAGGYGTFILARGDTRTTAHRVAYRELVGEFDDDLVVDHLCGVRCCVNPAHLEPVTQAENLHRCESASTVNATKTHCPLGHEYTPANTYRRKDRPGRMCRACNLIRMRERAIRGYRRPETA